VHIAVKDVNQYLTRIDDAWMTEAEVAAQLNCTTRHVNSLNRALAQSAICSLPETSAGTSNAEKPAEIQPLHPSTKW
jgi:hypothetical protein